MPTPTAIFANGAANSTTVSPTNMGKAIRNISALS